MLAGWFTQFFCFFFLIPAFQNLLVNGRSVNLMPDLDRVSSTSTNTTNASSTATNASSTSSLSPRPGCPSHAPCEERVCQHGGRCVDQWTQQSCHCATGYTGDHCGTQNMAHFRPESMIQFGSYATITEISFWISATQPSGLILYTVRTELYRLMPVVSFVCCCFCCCCLVLFLLLFVIVWLVGSLFVLCCLFVLFLCFFRGLLRCRNIRSKERIVGKGQLSGFFKIHFVCFLVVVLFVCFVVSLLLLFVLLICLLFGGCCCCLFVSLFLEGGGVEQCYHDG